MGVERRVPGRMTKHNVRAEDPNSQGPRQDFVDSAGMSNGSNAVPAHLGSAAIDPVFDRAGVGMLVVGADGRIMRSNAEFCRGLGYADDEVAGRAIADLVHADDLPEIDAAIKEMLADSEVRRVQQRIRSQDGSWKWSQSSISWLGAADGNAQLLVVVTDIASQKLVEAELHQTRARLNTVLSHAPIILWAIDREGRFTIFEGKGLEALGLAPADAIGKTGLEVFGEYPDVMANARRALSGETFRTTNQVGPVAFETYVTPMRNDEGQIVGALGVSIDTTQRQQLEQTQRHRIEFERLIAGISSHFINLEPYQTDAGICHALERIGRFCGVDRCYVFLFTEHGQTVEGTHEWSTAGVPRLGAGARPFVLDQELPWFAKIIKRPQIVHVPDVADLPPEAELERLRFTDRGALSMLAVPMVAGSKLVGYVGYECTRQPKDWSDEGIALLRLTGEIFANALEHKRNKDALLRARQQLESSVEARTAELSKANTSLRNQITQRKRIERELRAEQRLMEQLLTIHERDRQLIAYEIHDSLIQDVTGALMYLESLREACSPVWQAVGDQFERCCELLRQTIAEARRLISGLRPPIIDEQGIVAAIEYLIGEQSAEGGLHVEFEHDVQFFRLPPLVEGAIFRIVQEALTNIRRHSKAERARISLSDRHQRIRLEIRDWGIGFDPRHVKEHRFGLQGIRERARLLRGHAHVQSIPGCGTSILVDIPIGKDGPR
jgi:PAS domain S-box-containing protein